jgi:flagellar capping protein FliD
MRSLVNSPISALAGKVQRFDQLGYASNSNDDTVALADSSDLDSVLRDNLSGVKDFFTNATSGWATSFDKFLENTVGDEGSLAAQQKTLTNQSKGIDTQISDMERIVQSRRQAMIDSFTAMEKAQSQINAQMSFLSKISG